MKNKEWEGTEVDLSCAIQIVKYLEDVFCYSDKLLLRCVYTAVTELLSNISHHAYAGKTIESTESLWKVAIYRQSNNFISIVIEDYGITIPLSIITKLNLKPDNGVEYNDTQLIEEAIYQKNTAFTEGRGQGLKSITRNVDEGYIKNFVIRSRDGYFKYKEEPLISQLSDIDRSTGTSVEIIIPGVQK